LSPKVAGSDQIRLADYDSRRLLPARCSGGTGFQHTERIREQLAANGYRKHCVGGPMMVRSGTLFNLGINLNGLH